MKEFAYIVESLYSKFLLRDFCGKIIPGFIVIFVGTFILFFPNCSISKVFHLSFWGWLLFLGIAWITGFIVQSFGQLIHLISYEYKDKKGEKVNDGENEQWSKIKHILNNVCIFEGPTRSEIQQREQMFEKELQFFEYATDDEKQQRERTVVIKEAAGNGFVALIICFLFLILALILNCKEFPNVNWPLSDYWQIVLMFLVIIISIRSLYWLYRQSEINQIDYQEMVTKPHIPPTNSV
jgi:hypothetical protein